MCACHIKQGKWQRAIDTADKVCTRILVSSLKLFAGLFLTICMHIPPTSLVELLSSLDHFSRFSRRMQIMSRPSFEKGRL